MKRACCAALILVSFLLWEHGAHATTSGWIKGRVQFYQNQGGYCPSSRASCTGSNYLEAQYQTFQPVQNTIIEIQAQGGAQIGAGVTDRSGNFLVQWTSLANATTGFLQWYGENSDGGFNVRDGNGNRIVFTGNLKSLVNGTTSTTPTDWGDLRWGSSGFPNPLANVYDGAVRTMLDSIQYSATAWNNFWNITIYAFDTAGACPTSCASASAVVLDSDAATPYSSGARIAHELGHVTSSLSSQGSNSNSCNDYSFGSSGGWSLTSQEYSCAVLEEAFATFVGDVSRYWSNATESDTCYPGDVVCTTMLEPSSANSSTCASGEDRWPLTTMRFLWDVYDSQSDPSGVGESVAEPYWQVVENMNNFAAGSANHQRDEPWSCSGGSYCDPDGKSELDYWDNYQRVYSVNLAGPDAINCYPPGD